MSIAKTVKLLAQGLLRLPALLKLGLEALERQETEAAPAKTTMAAMGSEVFSEPAYIPLAKDSMRAEPGVPVYSLKNPAPVWQSGGGINHAAAAAEYPALGAGEPAQNREDVAELVYRRMDFDSRLVSQPMDEEEA
jgi:hypothetical protein